MSFLSGNVRAYGENCWAARGEIWQKRPEYPEARAGLSGERGELFTFLAGTLPPTDLGDYPPELLLTAVEDALTVREEHPWCRALPEEMFLLWVLCPRVNNEALAPCREEFRRELGPLVEGLTLPEAILAVNRWCAGRVTYRSTDQTTSSALDIYRRGWGRCGEESVFAVNALRSVGIAARQVYAPWWSHCDDNHAWVEAWDGENWRFLGACEPEPRLDMGWFTHAAGRAMLCHAKAFLGEGEGWEGFFPVASPLDLDRREGVAYESVTARYAQVRPFKVKVTVPDGGPAAGAQVEFCVLNEGALRPIASRVTGEDGQVRLNLGKGSLWVTARWQGQLAEALVHTGEKEGLTLPIGAAVEPGAFDFSAPADSGVTLSALAPEEQEKRRRILVLAQAARESRGGWTFLGPKECRRLGLTQKDFLGEWDALMPVLEESLEALPPEPVEGEGLVASPRIGWEPLAPWRRFLAGVMADTPAEALWARLEQDFPGLASFAELPQTPAGAWRLGRATEAGRRVLFCALCRSRGIPARLGPDGSPEFWQAWDFARADGLPTGMLTLECPGSQGQWSLMAWRDGWRRVEAQPGEPLVLAEGKYRLLSAVRLPNGNQLGWNRDFWLAAGETKTLAVEFRISQEGQLLQKLPLPELGFAHPGLSLLCWVRPGEEPTEHLLGELEPVREGLAELGCTVYVVCDGPARGKPLPLGAELHPWDGDAAEAAARRMYLEPGVFPLVILADREGFGRFACAGYSVGTGELVQRLARSITQG